MQKKSLWEKIKHAWHWIWHSDSLASWFVALLIIFILVKFIFFPFIGFVLGTSLPLVVVESGSMNHNFEWPQKILSAKVTGPLGLINEEKFKKWWDHAGSWYEKHSIDYEQAKLWPFKAGMERGDIVIVKKVSYYRVGDVVVFEAGQRHPVIHRVVAIKHKNDKTYYETKGDANPAQLSFEENIPEDKIYGKAIARIPKLGWLKLIFAKLFGLA